MNRIILFQGNQCWMAQYAGEHSEEIKALFGTAVIPTCFAVDYPADEVLAFIQQGHPDITVALRQGEFEVTK